VAWTSVSGRSQEIAGALGGTAYSIYPRFLRRKSLVALRYAYSGILTLLVLLRTRPDAVVVTNPPLFPGIFAWLYSLFSGCSLALDSHPSGFGRKNDRLSLALLPVHRWLASHVDVSLVTTEYWVNELRDWNAKGMVLHEAPPLWTVDDAGQLPDRPTVLFVGLFSADEPVDAVLDAARLVPEADFLITGDTRRADAHLIEAAPQNVRFTGFLDRPAYRDAVASADLILVLTTEPTSIVRGGYEAVYSRRPLVVSDWPSLREVFPFAIFAGHAPQELAAALRQALSMHATLIDLAPAAAAVQMQRWEQQLGLLRGYLNLPPLPSERRDAHGSPQGVA
jgi:glycosyltransferase involved in cell wall biosynthesis